MKVTGWTYWKKNEEIKNTDYEIVSGPKQEKFKEAVKEIVKEMKERGYKFNGHYHQYGKTGAPILDNKILFATSMRSWGDIMAEVLNLDNSDGMAYVEWAWSTPVIGKEMDRSILEEEKYPEDNKYVEVKNG